MKRQLPQTQSNKKLIPSNQSSSKKPRQKSNDARKGQVTQKSKDVQKKPQFVESHEKITNYYQKTIEDDEQLELRIARSRQALRLLEEERIRRMQQLQDNKIQSQLKKILTQKQHEIIIDEVNATKNCETNDVTAVQSQCSDKNTTSNGNEKTGMSETPTRQLSKQKSHSSQNSQLEDKIQRFEDLNRLAFIKTYLDHVKQQKIQNNQTSIQSQEQSDTMRSLHQKSGSEDYAEQERCPPIEILTRCEESPLKEHLECQHSSVNSMLEAAKNNDVEPGQYEIEDRIFRQQSAQKEVQKTVTPKIKEKVPQTKVQERKTNALSPARQFERSTRFEKKVQSPSQIRSESKPQKQTQSKSKDINPVQQKMSSPRETIKPQQRKLVTSYKSKAVISCMTSPSNQILNQEVSTPHSKVFTFSKGPQIIQQNCSPSSLKEEYTPSANSTQKPYFTNGNNDNNEISKLRISEKEQVRYPYHYQFSMESEESQNMQDLVQELHSLTSGSNCTPKNNAIPKSLKHSHHSNSAKQDQQFNLNSPDTACEIIFQKFQETIEKVIQEQNLKNLEMLRMQLNDSPTKPEEQIKEQSPQRSSLRNTEASQLENQNYIEDQPVQYEQEEVERVMNYSNHSKSASRREREIIPRIDSLPNRNIKSKSRDRQRSSSRYEDNETYNKHTSIFTEINKNSTLLRKIKQDASPKVPRHDDTYYPNKTARNTTTNYEVFNEDLQILLDSSKDDNNRYYYLQDEYETSIKLLNVKMLQNFRGKRNPDPNEVKQGQGVLMLLSGVDHQIMLTNDKSNIVNKQWRHFQEYLSSIGNAFNNLHKIRFAIENMIMHPHLFKSLKTLVLSIDETCGNGLIQKYLMCALELAFFVYTLLDNPIGQPQVKEQVVQKQDKRSVSRHNQQQQRPTVNSNNDNGQRRFMSPQSKQTRNSKFENTQQNHMMSQKFIASPQKVSFSNTVNFNDKDNNNTTPLRNRQQEMKENSTLRTQQDSHPHQKSPQEYKSQFSVIAKEKLRVQDMERKVRDLSKERDRLLRQIDQEDRTHSKNSSLSRSSNVNSQLLSTQCVSKVSSTKTFHIEDEKYRSMKDRQSLKKIDNNIMNHEEYYGSNQQQNAQTQRIAFHSRQKKSEEVPQNEMKSKMKEVSGRLKLLQQQEEELKQQLARFNKQSSYSKDL